MDREGPGVVRAPRGVLTATGPPLTLKQGIWSGLKPRVKESRLPKPLVGLLAESETAGSYLAWLL